MKKFLFIIFTAVVIAALIYAGIAVYVRSFAEKRVFSAEDVPSDADCILVLGAGVLPDGSPSFMLADRLNTGIELYKSGKAPKIIMSGDHGRAVYDEVNTMKSYAVDSGIPSDDCFMDHAGFSTYESIYRARDVFKAEKMIIVTQSYHLYRAVFIAQKLGLEAYGVSADTVQYPGHVYRNIREMAAYGKDFLWCMFDVKPKYLGEAIPVWGNGDVTNDK